MSYKDVDWGLYLGDVDDKPCYIIKNYKDGDGEGNFTYAEELGSFYGGHGYLDPKKYDSSYNFKYSIGRLIGKSVQQKRGIPQFDKDILSDCDLELISTCFGDTMKYTDVVMQLFIERDIHNFREDLNRKIINDRMAFGFFLWIVWMFVSMWIIIFLS